MPTMQISGPHLQHYPGILAELERNNISLDTLRYVDVVPKEQFIPETPFSPTFERTGKAVKTFEATAVLHSGERHVLTLAELIYDAHPLQGEGGRSHANHAD